MRFQFRSPLLLIPLFLIPLASAAFVAARVSGAPATRQEPQPPPFDLPAHYTKTEAEIPMRDGVTLFTSILTPKDASEPHPIILIRTPYSVAPYGSGKFPEMSDSTALFARENYIVVRQDVRGLNRSKGKWVEMRELIERKKPGDTDESTDTYDTVEWLIKNVPNNNGRVGMTGISYPGFFVSAGIINTHPAIKAASPQAPVSDLYMGDDNDHNGCFLLPHNFTFFLDFGRPGKPPVKLPTPDGYRFYLDLGPVINTDKLYMKGAYPYYSEIMQHPNYDDFWKKQNILPHLHDIHTPVMTVGGWYDAEDLAGTLKTYRAIKRQNPGGLRNMLVMGPWTHGGWSGGPGDRVADARFGSATAEFYRKNIELPFFNACLMGDGKPKLPEAYVFETGANRWRQFPSWPPPEATTRLLYLQPNGRLDFNPPGRPGGRKALVDTGPQFDEYISDPAKPVPSTYETTDFMPGDYMGEDQRFTANRLDVLVYQTEPLKQDLTIAGPITPNLWVSTSGTDSDYVVKLIDVYPDNTPNEKDERPGFQRGGWQFMVRGEPMRARFRHSFEHPQQMRPNTPTRVGWWMPDVCHTFKKGHRIMVHVHSSWFPFIDRNPQTYVPNIFTADPSVFKKATERIYHSNAHPSAIKLIVMRG